MSTFNEEVCLDVEVEYTCTFKGRPASGPTYSCGGQPAEPPEFNIRVMYNGQDITTILTEDQLDSLRDKAAEEYANQEPDYPDDDDY
jgi:hypothetical protein